MQRKSAEVTVAGHICLDVIPAIRAVSGGLAELLIPGKLIDVGPAVTATGGAVSNTGLALHRLGISTRLMGKVGDDLFGRAILDYLSQSGEGLETGMIVSSGEQSSYTIVISPPDVDRVFLHCPGANDTFAASDVSLDEVAQTGLFHFGYPPLMKRMYENEGEELRQLLASIKELGLTVTLDMAKPDPGSPAGRLDWVRLLQQVLPHVDVFFPSFEEILFMLDRSEYQRLQALQPGGDIVGFAEPSLLAKLADRLLAMGTAAVVIKLGEHGLYVRTSSSEERWVRAGRFAPRHPGEGWRDRELLAPVFQVEAAGTTGAGDCAIAGFINAMVKGFTLEDTINAAVAVGACNVEQSDATSGIPSWDYVQSRLSLGWARREVRLALTGWTFDSESGIWIGQNDRTNGGIRNDQAK
jgi:sugar/nucleoside kinase (ribokinase family)